MNLPPPLIFATDSGFGPLDGQARQRTRLIQHELRAPLSTVVGVVRRLLQNEPETRDLSRDLKLIERAALHLLNVIDDTLAPSAKHKASSQPGGSMPAPSLSYRRSDLGISTEELMEDFLECGSWLCQEHANTLRGSIQGLVPNLMRVDAKSVRQIVYNLLTNAARCCQHGAIAVRLSYLRKRNAVSLMISVMDTGVGLSQREIDRILSGLPPFDSPQAQGLGMRVIRERLAELNGTLDVQSRPGVGTAFSVKIPIEVIESAGWRRVDQDQFNRPPADLFGEAASVRDVGLEASQLVKLAELASCGEVTEVHQWIEHLAPLVSRDESLARFMDMLRRAADRLDLEMIVQVARSLSNCGPREGTSLEKTDSKPWKPRGNAVRGVGPARKQQASKRVAGPVTKH